MNALVCKPALLARVAAPSIEPGPSIHRQVAGLMGQVIVSGALGYAVVAALVAVGLPGVLAAVVGALVGAGRLGRLLLR